MAYEAGPAPIRVVGTTLSALRLHRTVNGVTRSYPLVGSITLMLGDKPQTFDRGVAPTSWLWPGVHISGIDGTAYVHFGPGGNSAVR